MTEPPPCAVKVTGMSPIGFPASRTDPVTFVAFTSASATDVGLATSNAWRTRYVSSPSVTFAVAVYEPAAR